MKVSRRIAIKFAKTGTIEIPTSIGTITPADGDISGAAFVTFLTIAPDSLKVLVLAEGAPIAWDLRGATNAQITGGEIGFFKLEQDGITETLLGSMAGAEMNTTFLSGLDASMIPHLRFSANIRGGLGEQLIIKGRNASIAYVEAEASQRFQFSAGLILGATLDEQVKMGG